MGAICEGLRVTVGGFKEKFVRELAVFGGLFDQYDDEIEAGGNPNQAYQGVAGEWKSKLCTRNAS